jgi:signal transduction histidine kinase
VALFNPDQAIMVCAILMMVAPIILFLTNSIHTAIIAMHLILVIQNFELHIFENAATEHCNTEKAVAFMQQVTFSSGINLYVINIFMLCLVYVYENNQKALTEELHRLLERATASEKAKDVLIASVSHELRNPLNSMLCSADILCSNSQHHLTQKQ